MSKPNFKDFSVLLVDDVRSTRAILRTLLRAFAIQDVSEASDGTDALQILSRQRVDLVITDLSMHPMDGLQLTRQLRHPDSGPNSLVPVIVVSAHSERSRVKDALEAGVTEFLLKPVTPVALGQRLKALIERPKQIVRAKSYLGPDRRRQPVCVKKQRRESDISRLTTFL